MPTSARILPAITATLLLMPQGVLPYHIYSVGPDGAVTITATAVWKIARKGMMFGEGTEVLNVNALNTYPDYPELGFDTPANRSRADQTAAEINRLVQANHEDGRRALLWSYEVENPSALLLAHPDLSCGNGTGWYESREGEVRAKVNGMCIYKPAAREFIQKRFNEILRRCPDVDGFIFSLHESSTRPIFGSCETCQTKTAAEKIRDTIDLLDECSLNAMQNVRPGKVPDNYARSHGLGYAYARDDPEKMNQAAEGLATSRKSVTLIVRGGLGDYYEFMIDSPLVRSDEYEYPCPHVSGLAERATHRFILDGCAAVRHLDMPACIPVYNGPALARDFRAASCSALAGWGYGRTRETGETTVFRLNALTVDSALALLANPETDLRTFVTQWYRREFGLGGTAASVLCSIVFRAYSIDILATCVNGLNFPLNGSGQPGSPETWNPQWYDRPGRCFATRIAAVRSQDDLAPAVYGFGYAKYGISFPLANVRKTVREKLEYVLGEKAAAVHLAALSLREAQSLEGQLPDGLFRDVVNQCRLSLWFCRARQAQARAFWTWWFYPDTPQSDLRSLVRRYESIVQEPIPDGYTMSSAEIRDDEHSNPYWGSELLRLSAHAVPFAGENR